jgi:hypothetical protein
VLGFGTEDLSREIAENVWFKDSFQCNCWSLVVEGLEVVISDRYLIVWHYMIRGLCDWRNMAFVFREFVWVLIYWLD